MNEIAGMHRLPSHAMWRIYKGARSMSSVANGNKH